MDETDAASTISSHAPAEDTPADAPAGSAEQTSVGKLREDAGTHLTGPNPIVDPDRLPADVTGPNPIVPAGARPGDAKAEGAKAGTAQAEAAQAEQASEPAGTSEPAAKNEPDEPDGAKEPDQIVPPGQAVATAEPADPVPASPRLPEMHRRPRAPAPEPSWGKVLATTISLWASRRFGRGRSTAGRPGAVAVYGTGTAAPSSPGSRWGGVRWPLVVFVLLLVILALVGLQLSGELSGSGSSQPAAKSGGNAGRTGNGSTGSLSGADAARNHAATWMAQQVTSSDVIACDPLMCSTLQADGVAASRLMAVQPTTPDPFGADVVAASSSIRSQFGSRLVSEYAPELIASFGTGANRVDIRAVASFGAAAFKAKERADLAARESAGAQLLKNSFHVTARGASQIRAGQVDSRLLVTLAALLSQGPVQVSSFGDTGPGAPVLYRQVRLVNAPGQTGTSALNAELKQVKTQRNSYLPAHAQIVHLANGQSALRIEFGAPDPPGLLSGGNS